MINRNQRELIWKYCYKMGATHYDVAQQLAGHMEEWIKTNMHCDVVSFEDSFRNMQAVFTKKKCRSMLDTGSHAICDRIRREWMHTFLGYFTWPHVGLAFLLLILVWITNQYLVLNKFAAVAVNILNILNISLAFGRGEIVYRNRSEKIEAMAGFEQLMRIQCWFLVLPLLYGLVSIINAFGLVLPAVGNELLLYLFPFVLLVLLAWRETAIISHKKMRREYPETFGSVNGEWAMVNSE